MAIDTDATKPTDPGAHTQAGPIASTQQSAESASSTGSTGEGAHSAMARLISQEQARLFPVAPDDIPTDSP